MIFISVLLTTLLNPHSFTQPNHLVDSIINASLKETAYKSKIDILQSNIKRIYTTNFDETIEIARFGYALADKQNDAANKGDFFRLIGGAFMRKGHVDSASNYYYQALNLLQPTKNSEKLGLLFDDMARMYRKLKQPDRALSFYEQALALYEAENNQEGIARINNESGVVFRDKGDYKTANERFEKSLRIQRSRNDSLGIGYSLEFLGYNQLLIKDYKKSESYLKEALEIRKRLKDKFALMLNYTALGEFYKETKQISLSTDYFKQSNTLARQIKFPDIQKYNYSQIMKNYESLNNFEQAYHNLKAFNLLNDSLYNSQKLKDVEEITTKYATAEKEKELLKQRTTIAENELRLKNRNEWIVGLSSLVMIIGLIGFFVYKQQVLKNIKQQQENELNLALEKIENQNQLQAQRMSISRDLHDNIGAQLTFIISAIDTIKYYIKDKEEHVTSRLDNIGEFAKETIWELRDTIWAMNKSSITIEDLKTRISNFLEKAKQSQQELDLSLMVEPTVPENLTFTALQGLNIFRIIQEATHNALKYSEARHIQIQISKENSINFLISDDGKGFKENEVEPGNGLLNMRKRAIQLDSELILKSTLNTGTSIEFRIRNT